MKKRTMVLAGLMAVTALLGGCASTGSYSTYSETVHVAPRHRGSNTRRGRRPSSAMSGSPVTGTGAAAATSGCRGAGKRRGTGSSGGPALGA